MNVRRAITLLTVLFFVTLMTASADASVYLKGISPTIAEPGQTVTLRTVSGVHLYARLPLYAIRRALAPRDHRCANGRGLCEPHVPGPPSAPAFRRIATLNFRHSLHQDVVFSAPKSPGRYVFVFYCGPCYRGSGGSLVTTPKLVLTVR